MVRKVYKKIGLRKDRNLTDLANPSEALDNLLDTLIDSAQSTFVSQDLDAIRGVYSLGLSSDDYRQIINSATKITTSTGNIQDFLPRITYQNKIDTFNIFSGNPRIFGGNGLTAKYYRREEVFENTVGIFSGTPFKIDNFWEAGNFYYTSKITPESVDVNGGVEWEGYFIPTVSGSHTITINSSAGFTFEFETEGYDVGIGTYTEISRIGFSTSFAATGSANSNVITLSNAANTKNIGIGLSVAAVGIVTGTTVGNFNRTTGVISLSPPTGFSTALYANVNGSVNFFKSIGDQTSISYSTYVLNQYERYNIRFRYFIPQAIDATSSQRFIDINLLQPKNTESIDFRYNYLYSLDYDFSESKKGDFNRFLENSIDFSGGTLGSLTNPNDYVKVKTSKKIDITYQPKTNVTGIIKSSTSASITSGNNIMSVSDTTNIEVGNYIFGTGIVEGTTVTEISINAFVILSQDATSTTSGTYTFVEHRGFVKRAVGSSSGSTLTLSSGNTNSLKSGMIAIGAGIQPYTGITTTTSNTILAISPSQTIGAGTTVYFYQSRGLINNALVEYCLPTQTKCLIVTATTVTGSTVIPVSDSTDVGNGWSVQGIQFAPGTTVSGAPTSPTSITISTPTIADLSANANFTVTNAPDDRTLCCPPTDVSFPFNGTLRGLETPTDAKSLRIESGDISFGSLTAGVSSPNITAYTTADLSGSRLLIQTPPVQVGTSQTTIFKILCA